MTFPLPPWGGGKDALTAKSQVKPYISEPKLVDLLRLTDEITRMIKGLIVLVPKLYLGTPLGFKLRFGVQSKALQIIGFPSAAWEPDKNLKLKTQNRATQSQAGSLCHYRPYNSKLQCLSFPK